ncbi:hypothetical protein PF008_g18646 [Phytophthora fragariae]|uniref:Secreted protein n=1 Tax=Phytophthora fragariae TaxID=53985 RepID=A0A6G0R4Q6_9STRA|nr:hypothetical protein PF008_g18646 [Phytophthora fragariae]
MCFLTALLVASVCVASRLHSVSKDWSAATNACEFVSRVSVCGKKKAFCTALRLERRCTGLFNCGV